MATDAERQAERQAWRRWVRGGATPPEPEPEPEPKPPGDSDGGRRGDGPAGADRHQDVNDWLRGGRDGLPPAA